MTDETEELAMPESVEPDTSPDSTESEVEEVTEDADPIEAAEESDGEDSDSPDDEPEPEFVEIEWEGETYSVPAKLKDGILRQSDYTKKTQEVAEQRKAIEARQAEIERQAQMQRDHLQDVAELTSIDRQIEAYDQIDWRQLQQADPQEFIRLDWERRSLVEQRNSKTEQLSKKQQEALAKQQQEVAKRREEGLAALKRDIPDWSDETAKRVSEYGTTTAGFTPQEIATVIDPRMVKVLDKARRWDQLQAKAKVKPKPEATPVKPIRAQKASATKNPDKMSVDEWLKHREAQLAKK